MQLLTRREYNLILRSLDKYELYMNNKEKELSETLQEDSTITKGSLLKQASFSHFLSKGSF